MKAAAAVPTTKKKPSKISGTTRRPEDFFQPMGYVAQLWSITSTQYMTCKILKLRVCQTRTTMGPWVLIIRQHHMFGQCIAS